MATRKKPAVHGGVDQGRVSGPKTPAQNMPRTSIDDFNAKARRGRELELWHQWDQGGRKPEHLEPLMQSIDNIIKSQARKFQGSGYGGSIPVVALEQELRNLALKGIEKFDPNRGVQLTTHIYNQFPAVTTFVAKGRNYAGVPKARVDKFQAFQNAKMELSEGLGREPSAEELHLHLGWKNINETKRMMKSFRPEAFSHAPIEGDEGIAPSQMRSLIMLMPSLLDAEERQAFDAIFPGGNVPTGKFDAKQVARQLNIPEHQVYRLRERIMRKMEPHLKKM